MLRGKLILCAVLITVYQEARGAAVPYIRFPKIGEESNDLPIELSDTKVPTEVVRGMVQEGVPPPLCAGIICTSPRVGPVCAFDATGKARTFATLCELEAVSCRESTYYAVTSLGEC